MVRTQETTVTDIRPVDRHEAEQLSERMAESMLTLLRGLSSEEWEKPTDCELWRVRDMAAHLVGWSEALTSFKEMGSQGIGALRRRKELGNLVDAQNQVQVDAFRDISTDELLRRMEAATPGAARRRLGTSKYLGWIPFYMGYMGGWINVSYLTDAIFPRDWLMHRIDICRATGRPFSPTQADQRMLDDIVRDWFGRSGATARLELTGEPGGTYVSATPTTATLRAESLEFIRMLFGRADTSVVAVEGDETSARRWLDTFFPV